MKFIEARYLVLVGLLLTAVTLYQMVGFTDQTSPQTIVVAGIIQGSGLGLVFVPLEHGRVRDAAGASAHRRHRDADAGAQSSAARSASRW